MKHCCSLRLIVIALFGLSMVSIFYIHTCPYGNKKTQFQLLTKKLYYLFSQISDSHKCIQSKNLMSQNISYVWTNIGAMVDDCSKDLFRTLNATTSIKEILVTDLELKYFILPFNHADASCNIISLGIGGETDSEERIKKLMPQCKFLGIDSGANKSHEIYEGQLGGRYVEGVVGAKNGNFTASILEPSGYVLKELQHFAFSDILSKHLKGVLIDLVFMDIEGSEYELIKDMIDNADQYPPICQINVEFHDSSKKDPIMLPLFSQLFERSQYIAIRGGLFFSQINKFHLVNYQNSECLKKYIIK